MSARKSSYREKSVIGFRTKYVYRHGQMVEINYKHDRRVYRVTSENLRRNECGKHCRKK